MLEYGIMYRKAKVMATIEAVLLFDINSVILYPKDITNNDNNACNNLLKNVGREPRQCVPSHR